jgi:hypothetical protein
MLTFEAVSYTVPAYPEIGDSFFKGTGVLPLDLDGILAAVHDHFVIEPQVVQVVAVSISSFRRTTSSLSCPQTRSRMEGCCWLPVHVRDGESYRG